MNWDGGARALGSLPLGSPSPKWECVLPFLRAEAEDGKGIVKDTEIEPGPSLTSPKPQLNHP